MFFFFFYGNPNIHTTHHFEFNTQNRQRSKQLLHLNPWAFTPSKKKDRKIEISLSKLPFNHMLRFIRSFCVHPLNFCL